ncbi:recombination protein NinG [Klebsiella aerogenes]|nr:recombination protein NinG [Klebsiella aerogenes]
MTQRVVNDYIRERDYDLPCISCGTFLRHAHCSHNVSTG